MSRWGHLPQGPYVLWGSVGGLLLLVLNLVSACSEESSQRFAAQAPETAYAGSAVCANCHGGIARSYHQTGMGRSFYRPSPADTPETFGPQRIVQDPHKNFAYRAYWEKDSLYIHEFRLREGDTVHSRRERVDYIVGSGHQTRSYILERNDFLYEAPITWYVRKQRWDLSPGYHKGNNSRFSRPIGQECMSCHNGRSGHVAGTINRYDSVALGIGCERCHGPGSAHVAKMRAGEMVNTETETDYSIVNPAKLSLEKRFDVCQQCHLQGVEVPLPLPQREKTALAEFRPGLRLREIKDIFLVNREDQSQFGIASHAERLRQSACFRGSDGQLTCTTCHDPHQPVGETPKAYYRNICQDCHQPNKEPLCSAPMAKRQAEGDDCASCHMPRGGTHDIPHVSFTDHDIRVVSQQEAPVTANNNGKLRSATREEPPASSVGAAYLTYFERFEGKPAYLEPARAKLSEDHPFHLAKLHLFLNQPEQALKAINTSLAADPDNPWKRFKRGEILIALGRRQAARDLFAELYEAHPGLTEAGLKLAELELKLRPGQRTALYKARAVLQRLRQTKPFSPKILSNLGFIELNLGRNGRAERFLTKALEYSPDHSKALQNLAHLRASQGQLAEARRLWSRFKQSLPEDAQVPPAPKNL